MNALLARIKRIFHWWTSTAIPSSEAMVSPSSAPIGHNRPPRAKRKAESFGEYYYLDNVLDDLRDYFDALRLLRKQDREAYDIYSKTGAFVYNTSARALLTTGMPASWRNGSRPAFGMLHLNFSKLDDAQKINVSLAYFQKIERVDGVQVSRGDLYVVTMFYSDRKSGHSFVGTYYVDVDADGEPHLLKQMQRSNGRFPVRAWAYPSFLKSIGTKEKTWGTPETFATSLFSLLVGGIENSQSGVQVRAKKGSIAAIFNVDMLRMPYFFKDRDKTINENGATKRIFHIARAHKRTLPDGREIFVKSHFRGERRFSWNGHDITVSMPGLHHNMLGDLDFTAKIVGDEDQNPPGMIDAGEVGEIIDRHMAA